MKKAFARYGMLGVAALTILSLALMLGLFRSAHAQLVPNGNTGTNIMSGPVQISNQAGQQIQYNLTYSGSGTAMRSAQTTFEVQAIVPGPSGNQTIRSVWTVAHSMDPSCNITCFTLVSTGSNLDLYQDGVLLTANSLNQLPPGTPVIGYRVNSQTRVIPGGLPGPNFLLGTTQVMASDGTTIVAWGKHHELTGNVTLIK